MLDFTCFAIGGQLSISDETTDTRWVAMVRALALMTAPAIRTRFLRYLNYDGRTTFMEYVIRSEFAIKFEQKMPG